MLGLLLSLHTALNISHYIPHCDLIMPTQVSRAWLSMAANHLCFYMDVGQVGVWRERIGFLLLQGYNCVNRSKAPQLKSFLIASWWGTYCL